MGEGGKCQCSEINKDWNVVCYSRGDLQSANYLTDYLFLKIVLFLFVSCVCVYSCEGGSGSPFMYVEVRELLAGFSSLSEELGLSGLVPNDLPC